jgi:GNAT superfamily N-acetyltransferase
MRPVRPRTQPAAPRTRRSRPTRQNPLADIRVTPLTGQALSGRLADLAALRISVFRAFPYLYDGDADYERDYLTSYADSPGAVVIGAFDGDRLVGAATAAPMEDHAAEFAAPFQARGHDLSTILYFGESVLLPDYRGHGIGHAFFEGREDHARALGRSHATFCAVIRPADHVARPADYSPLDSFWRKRGYAPLDGVIGHYGWKDLGDSAETDKPMQFWMREL